MLNSRQLHFVAVAAVGVATSAVTAPSAGQDDRVTDANDAIYVDRTPVSCVAMSRIERTLVLNDRAILFVGRGDRAYVNLLEADCPTLKTNGLFRYRIDSGIRTARLCSTQAITVIDRLTNTLSYTCRLGRFHPVTKILAEMLLDPTRTYSVEMEPITRQPQGDDRADSE